MYHPHTKQTHNIASGFYYSDGITLSDDGSYLLVVETDALRVVKVWLEGDKVGGQPVMLSGAFRSSCAASHAGMRAAGATPQVLLQESSISPSCMASTLQTQRGEARAGGTSCYSCALFVSGLYYCFTIFAYQTLCYQAGKREVLVDSLPGLPAGLSKAADGNMWVSMTVPVPPYNK